MKYQATDCDFAHKFARVKRSGVHQTGDGVWILHGYFPDRIPPAKLFHRASSSSSMAIPFICLQKTFQPQRAPAGAMVSRGRRAVPSSLRVGALYF
jgi:hypothetical protein